jgi:hypothetical protein
MVEEQNEVPVQEPVSDWANGNVQVETWRRCRCQEREHGKIWYVSELNFHVSMQVDNPSDPCRRRLHWEMKL